ncbi:MAG: MFS transporter [Sulfurifustis sp.]
MTANTPARRAGRREWIALAAIALPCALYSMDLTVLNLAVPALSEHLKPTASQLLWIVDIYGFLVAASLIAMGTLGDHIGRRRLLLMGSVGFGIASVLAAFSNSAEMLIAARALLGIAGATIAPSTLSLIRNMFLDASERTFAIGVWVTSYSIGSALGPLIGGLLLEHYWWGSVFLLAVPATLLLLVVGPMLLPEFRAPSTERIDLWSVALSLVAVLSVVYGLKQMAEHGFGGWPAIYVVSGVAIGTLFVRRQRTLADPLIDLRLFRNPLFSVAVTTYTLSLFVALGIFLLMAQYLQLVLGLSPLTAGLWTIPSSVGFVVGSLVAPVVVRYMHPAFAMAGSLALAAVGFALLTQTDGDFALAILVTGSFILSFGISPVVTLATDLVVGTAPPEHAGAAAAISETGAELGGALGIALLGSIAIAVYRDVMTHAAPIGIAPDKLAAASATLGGAVAVAGLLPVHDGAQLLGAARTAFVESFHVAAGLSAIILIVLSIATAVVLRRASARIEAVHGPRARLRRYKN